MSFFGLVKLALRGLHTNKLRTWLTTLGIVIGIATVVVVLSVGESAKLAVSKQLLAFGGNTIFAEISVPNSSHSQSGANMVTGVQITTMKEVDMEAVKQIPNVINAYAAVMSPQKITFGNISVRGTIFGTNQSYPLVDNVRVAQGRFFNLGEEKGVMAVAVLGKKLAEDLFPNTNPLDQTIRIKNLNYKVIGVMEGRGTSFFMDLDDMAFVPLKTAQKMVIGIDFITYFSSKIERRELAAQTAEDIRILLRKRHGIPLDNPKKDDFQVTTMDDAMELTGSIIGGVSLLLTTIAIISLLVGGVGIMNIMYVSVSERTREIGLRKAIGAREDDILYQFLLEAIGVTIGGGVLGVILGMMLIALAGLGAYYFKIDWQFIISLNSILLALGAAAAVGLFFGIYPARKAAKLDAIEALRYE